MAEQTFPASQTLGSFGKTNVAEVRCALLSAPFSDQTRRWTILPQVSESKGSPELSMILMNLVLGASIFHFTASDEEIRKLVSDFSHLRRLSGLAISPKRQYWLIDDHALETLCSCNETRRQMVLTDLCGGSNAGSVRSNDFTQSFPSDPTPACDRETPEVRFSVTLPNEDRFAKRLADDDKEFDRLREKFLHKKCWRCLSAGHNRFRCPLKFNRCARCLKVGHAHYACESVLLTSLRRRESVQVFVKEPRLPAQ